VIAAIAYIRETNTYHGDTEDTEDTEERAGACWVRVRVNASD